MMNSLPQVTWRTWCICWLWMMSLWCVAAKAQTVTPWLTTGDQSALLEMQESSSLVPYAGGGTTVVVDSETTYQSVDGFGFCLTQGSAEVIHGLDPETKASLLDDLFGPTGLGISMLRIGLGASDLSNSVYTYNESPGDVDMLNFSLEGPDLEHLIPLIQDILSINPSLKLMASPWTAPTWMKTNNAWIGGSLDPQYYTAYSHYFLRYLQEMG
ncbi:beta-glucosidase, partial [Flavobacteriales bacterium]|nr:beta-glucosidase [Flavobacteriales bacterium]